MPAEFRHHTVSVPSTVGPFLVEEKETFSGPVSSAGCAINGFRLEYSSTDRRLQEIEVDTDFINIVGSDVNFRVQCNLKDDTANDAYTGYVTVTVMAEVP